MKQHLFSVLVAAGFIGLSAIGCVDDKTMTTDQFGPEDGDEMAAPAEPAAEPEAAKPQPPPGPVTCVTIKRGVLGDVQDTFIPGDYNNYAPGGEFNMYSGVSSGGNINRVLVNFNLSSIPQYATITSATFNIYKSWSADNATVNVYRSTSEWQEATANLATPVTFDPVAIGSFNGGGVGFKSVDLKNVVQGWKNGSPQRGIVIDEQPTQAHHYFSSESVSLAPSLDVCYSAATCNDGIQNQGETGPDCGGPCGSCVSCSDGIQNQGEQGIDCGGPCAACPYVQITAGGEAYGHHGQCSGWNSCGNAATCALWACYAKGYSHLTSYGAEMPCTSFGVCHLFNSPCGGPGQCSIQYNWGNWCGVAGVTDIKCHN